MNKIKLLLIIILLIPVLGSSKSTPGAITKFCEVHFKGQIAGIGEPYNTTDVKKDNLPSRRIIDFAVTSITSCLWYEHGGRGYHQHLVIFNTINPKEIHKAYIFSEPVKHKKIFDLLDDSTLLESCESDTNNL